jgi:hypothetical protein
VDDGRGLAQLRPSGTTFSILVVSILAAIFLFIGTSGPILAQPSPGAPVVGNLPIQSMHQDPWFFTVAAASLAGWILGAVKGFSTSADWLKRYNHNPPIYLVFASDLLVFVVLGAYFGTGIYNPTNFVSAIAAGLTWPIGLWALATTDRSSQADSNASPQTSATAGTPAASAGGGS